jgi:IclR family transcriptional regulator, KDG regulon repressor
MKTVHTTNGKYLVEAVSRALDVLDSFRDSEELTLNEINRRVGLTKSRGFRLLYTLAEHGYVEKDLEGTHYRLGVKLFERASHLRRDVKRVAEPFMRQIHLRFNETVNLGVIHNGDVLYIDLLEPSRSFRMSAMVGSRMPLKSTSLGKAMLAFLPDGQGNALLSAAGRALKRELDLVRRHGYAIDDEENEPNVACIGVPILDRTGYAVAAMSVSGPVARILPNRKEISAVLIAACREISRQLGFAGAPSAAVAAGPQ